MTCRYDGCTVKRTEENAYHLSYKLLVGPNSGVLGSVAVE